MRISCNDSVYSDEPSNSFENLIPSHTSHRPPQATKNNANRSNLKTIKRSNKVFEATQLPVVLNLNPRSVYNKVKEFETLFEEMDVDVVFMSESWERENLRLEQLLNLEHVEIIPKSPFKPKLR